MHRTGDQSKTELFCHNYGLDIRKIGVLAQLRNLDKLKHSVNKSSIGGSTYMTHYEKALERSILNFIPLLPSSGTEIKLGMIDYTFKILGGVVTFGLIIIALRRKFERKFRH